MRLTLSLQAEQHIKNELARELGQLQEKLGELKETVMLSLTVKDWAMGTSLWGGQC